MPKVLYKTYKILTLPVLNVYFNNDVDDGKDHYFKLCWGNIMVLFFSLVILMAGTLFILTLR